MESRPGGKKKEAGREGSVEKGGILEQKEKKIGWPEKVMLRQLWPPPRLGSFLHSYSTAPSSTTPSFPPQLYPFTLVISAICNIQ